MDASLDTNVIIHLYKANSQHILFNRFEKLKVYQFIRKIEMTNHASEEIIASFDKDVETGKIDLVDDNFLRDIGMYNIFSGHVKDIRILFDGSDLGEVFAISMAKTLGCISLVTDDIKEHGPHYTLMRIPDSDVMPFAFYEILFLDYLDGQITAKEFLSSFNNICYVSGLNIDLDSVFKKFIRRFWYNPYSEREKTWMESFCTANHINAKEKLQRLSRYLPR